MHRLGSVLLMLAASGGAVASVGSEQTVASVLPAAEQGDAGAQYRLAEMYHAGNGVAVDLVEAFLWNGRAAQQGNADAQFKQGLHYRAGRLFPADPVRSYMWLSLADARDHPLARPVLNSVAQELSPDQLTEARRLVSLWEQTLGSETTCGEPRAR